MSYLIVIQVPGPKQHLIEDALGVAKLVLHREGVLKREELGTYTRPSRFDDDESEVVRLVRFDAGNGSADPEVAAELEAALRKAFNAAKMKHGKAMVYVASGMPAVR